jgi:hypothetical protein
MNLVGLYREHEAISKVYCPACFTVLKLNNKFTGYKSVPTQGVPGLSICHNCHDNKGPKKEQLEALAKWDKIEKP